MTQRIVNFMDLETTGFIDDTDDHRIVEACCILYDLDTEQHVKTYLWRINPERPIPLKASNIHNIKNADVENEPAMKVVGSAIRGTIEPSFLVVAHNGYHFDFPFIKRELMRVGVPLTLPKTFDTMVEGRFATPHGKNCTLGELSTSLDVPFDKAKAHGAEYDVQVMAKCFFEGRRLGWFNVL